MDGCVLVNGEHIIKSCVSNSQPLNKAAVNCNRKLHHNSLILSTYKISKQYSNLSTIVLHDYNVDQCIIYNNYNGWIIMEYIVPSSLV